VTNTFTTHATPAAFAAHALNRSNYDTIAWHYLIDSRPDLIFGGGGYGVTQSAAEEAGYTVVTDRNSLEDLTPMQGQTVYGLFGEGNMPYETEGLGDLPHLSEMAVRSFELVRDDPDGFFLMIEGGRIDHAGHSNDVGPLVREVIEFDEAICRVQEMIEDWSETLVIVTADHETGGLEVVSSNGAGELPDVTWSTTGHTGRNVPVYARGARAEEFAGVIDNTDICGILARFH
jgi:alkaline phosphatase